MTRTRRPYVLGGPAIRITNCMDTPQTYCVCQSHCQAGLWRPGPFRARPAAWHRVRQAALPCYPALPPQCRTSANGRRHGPRSLAPGSEPYVTRITAGQVHSPSPTAQPVVHGRISLNPRRRAPREDRSQDLVPAPATRRKAASLHSARSETGSDSCPATQQGRLASRAGTDPVGSNSVSRAGPRPNLGGERDRARSFRRHTRPDPPAARPSPQTCHRRARAARVVGLGGPAVCVAASLSTFPVKSERANSDKTAARACASQPPCAALALAVGHAGAVVNVTSVHLAPHTSAGPATPSRRPPQAPWSAPHAAP